MFGWWKRKNDDFEWHQYVRTTILARRAHRREKIDHAKVQAADGIKFGIRQSSSWSQSGAKRLWAGIRRGLAAAQQLVVKTGRAIAVRARPIASRTGRWLATSLSTVWSTISATAGYSSSVLARGMRSAGALFYQPSVRAPVGFIGVLAGLAAIWQWYGHGFDIQAKSALAISFTALLLVYGPIFFHRYQITMPVWVSWIGNSLRNLPGTLFNVAKSRGASKPSNNSGANARSAKGSARGVATGLAGIAVAAGLAGLGWFGYKSMPAASNLLSGMTLQLPFSGKSEPIVGEATALTGDLLEIDDQTIALAGIDAPEILQRCKRGRRKWRCGATARWALAKLIRNKELHCERTGTDDSGNIQATCRIDKTDVAAQLVRKGYVFATTGIMATYSAQEAEAKAARRRIWKGSNERPETFRAKTWEEAKRRAPDGCPIKGDVTRAGKVYVLPWAANYKKTSIKTSKGERWFCSEQSARDAGWRART